MNSLFSQQGFWAVIGTITGAIVASATNLGIQWWQRRQQREMAAMRVAIELRHWLNSVVDSIYSAKNFVSSGGQVGEEHATILPFRFEDSLDNVLFLQRNIATDILDLIHEKDYKNANIRDIIEWIADEDRVREEFLVSSAKLAIVGVTIYRKLNRSLKWADTGLTEHAEKMLQGEIEAYEIVRQKRAEESSKIMDGSAL
jgi:hypothetical protein